MNFFQNLTSQITKIAEEVADAVIETVNEIANAEDLYETRNTPARTSKKEDLNEDWTLLEGDIENADDFKERVVRLPDKHDEYHGVWTAQIENFDGVWDSDENKKEFLTLLDAGSKSIDLLSSRAWKYGVPSVYKISVYKSLLPNFDNNPEKFAKLKQEYLQGGIPKQILEDIQEDMKFAKKIEFFSKMQAFDILEETLFLIFSIYFKDQEVYPQGLAYICCPILYLLLKDDTPTDNTNSYRLNESMKIIEKEAVTQEDRIIKRKMIDFYLEKIQCDLFNFISLFYQDQETGLSSLHQNPLEFIITISELLTEFSEKIILHLTKNEVDLTSACLSWVVHFLVPEFEKLQIIVQFWDKYIVARTQMGLFHCCLCVSILHHYEKEILGMNAEEILLFFQSPPLLNMTSTEIAQIIQFATHIFEKNRLFVSNIKCIINDTNTQNPEIVINNESTNDTQ